MLTIVTKSCYNHYMIIRMFLILLILSMFLSCQGKKISDPEISDPIEQDYAVVEEVEEISITDNNSYGIVDTVQTNEIMPLETVEAIDMKEDYDNAFSVWTRASKNHFLTPVLTI